MSITELSILLPCHSLEDFPLELTGDDAQGLLAAWSALWHPELLFAAGKTPRWYRADFPPDDVQGRIIAIPAVSEPLLPTGWIGRAEEQGATLVRAQTDRQEIVSRALSRLDEPRRPLDAELVADFLALGFAYLGLELLTRQMRYISNLDEVYFENQVMAAVRAAVESGPTDAREHLQTTFDVLLDGRERFYPVDAYLLDLTLVAPTTLGSALRKELTSGAAVNLLLSAATLETISSQEPATLAALADALERGTVALIGGEYEESPLPLLSAESIRAELIRGAEVYERILGRRPKVFGRRTAGLIASLPQILTRLGYVGALHTTLDEGKLPRTEQSKTRWQGTDHSSIDAFARVPLDARAAGTFLSLASKLGETMDLDHVATLAFAHWPGDVSPWYDDLRRVHQFVPLFGKFVTVDEFFTQTDTTGQFAKLTPDDYQSPYLAQAVRGGAVDPISASVRREQEAVQRIAESGIAMLEAALTPAGSIAQSLTAGGDPSRRGTLFVNSFGFASVATVDPRDWIEGAPRQSVSVPAMGFTWIGLVAPVAPVGSKKGPKPIAVERTLANEHFEVLIHPETGGIGAIRNNRTRGNRLSQQLALRLRDTSTRYSNDADPHDYSAMRADSIQVTTSDQAVGEIVSRGRLVGPDDAVFAKFEQLARLERASRIVEIEIRLEIDRLPDGDPWRSYYASRLAWASDDIELRRSLTGTSQPCETGRIEAPHFVEIRDDRVRTALLTGGLAYHRRSGDRMLDTLLVVAGERERHFRLGIGIDLPSAPTAALTVLGARPLAIPKMPQPAGHPTGWLFRIEGTSVVATAWEPIAAADSEGSAAGTVSGFRVRLLETEGKPARAKLHSFRPIRAARQVDLLGGTLVELRVIGEAVAMDLGAYEWLEVEVEWKKGDA